MTTKTRLTLYLFALYSIATFTSFASSLTTGKPHEKVQSLTEANFDEALNDPANGLWLLKFYAPWCGHCKKLAPTLDKMATYISGKFAIGKIDCTTETKLCKDPKFNIKGYPTLMIYKDGNFFEYAGRRRDADSMIEFMEKMSQPSVKLVNSFEEFMNDVLDTGLDGGGVAFLAFDSKAKEIQIMNKKKDNSGGNDRVIKRADVTSVEKYISSTKFLQIYGQTSRILQSSSSSFALLHPSKFGEVVKFFDKEDLPSITTMKKNQPLLLRIEKGARPKVYNGDLLSSENVIDWVKNNVMPLVIQLEGHNFRTVSSLGKPLVIGITNPEVIEQKGKEESFLKELLYLAQDDGQMNITNKYKFAQMNGKKFHSFLEQFNITSSSRIPQAIVVNVQNRTFFQNETYTNVHDLLVGIENGEIKEQIQGDRSGSSIFQKIKLWFVSNMPLSVVIVVLSILVIFMSIALCCGNDDDGGGDQLATRMEIQREILRTKRYGDKKEKVRRKTMKED